MHLLESLATSCGLKINKPFIYDKYYPLNFDKYIFLETNDPKNPASNYDYWQEVVDGLLPILNEKNIKILQFCDENDLKLTNCYTIINKSRAQKSFLIKNSLLYIGSNIFSIQVASYFNKKIIGLYSNFYSSQYYPYWSDKKDIEIIEVFETKKPSFINNEAPKAVNNLKPDKITNLIFNKLDINSNSLYEYTYIGNNYINKTIETIPNIVVNPGVFGAPHIILRMDIEFNEEILEAQLKISKVLIVTNKEISEELIKKYKQNIVQVFYKIEEDNNPNFIKILKNYNINYILASYLKQEDINKIKINYMDFGLILKLYHKTKDEFKQKYKYYKSNKFILSNNKLYMSEAALDKNLPIKDFNQNLQEIIDTEKFWNNAADYAFLVD